MTSALDFHKLGVRFGHDPVTGTQRASFALCKPEVRGQMVAEIRRRSEIFAPLLPHAEHYTPVQIAPGHFKRYGQCAHCGDAMPSNRGGCCPLCGSAIRVAMGLTKLPAEETP